MRVMRKAGEGRRGFSGGIRAQLLEQEPCQEVSRRAYKTVLHYPVAWCEEEENERQERRNRGPISRHLGDESDDPTVAFN